ncbi:hypothetical protein MKX03_013516 [Papaver bracteatum]|nr:hypothetical protein MKX03_013516 [Papaver bracteatum]
MVSAQHTFFSCIDLSCFFQSKGSINLSGYEAAVRNGEMKMCLNLQAEMQYMGVIELLVGIAGAVGCKEASGAGYNKHLFLNMITHGEQNEWKLGPVELVKILRMRAHKCIELMNVRW